MNTENRPDISIVIVNYNVRSYLEQCLLSVRDAVRDLRYEIFVVDNASSDGSEHYIPPRFPEVKYIYNTENTGFARANNQAIRQSRGRYVLLLNPDTVLGESVLTESCRFMDEHPDTGALGVKMLDGSGAFLPESKRGFPSPWVSFCKVFGLSRIFPRSRCFGRYHLRYLDENAVNTVDVLAGAYMLLRRDVLDKCGLLDEAFFMYGEDIDLSYRVTLAGAVNSYLPLRIIHYKGESTKKESIRYVRVFYEAMLIFLKKHYPRNRVNRFFIKTAIYLRASAAVTRRKVLPRKAKPEKPGVWYVLSRKSGAIEDLLRKQHVAHINIGTTPDTIGLRMARPSGASTEHIVFDRELLSYGEIIACIEKWSLPGRRKFYIYSPASGAIVSAHQIIE